jgi:hypothetical protein
MRILTDRELALEELSKRAERLEQVYVCVWIHSAQTLSLYPYVPANLCRSRA